MPHRCRDCSTVIPDESENLLSGCPDCGNGSWEYVEAEDDPDEDESQHEARTEFVDSESLPSMPPAEALQSQPDTGRADAAQPDATSVSAVDDVEEVQEQLNNQYEGIRIVRQGRYEINLTQLYRGADYVITVGDDGAYHVKQADSLKSE